MPKFNIMDEDLPPIPVEVENRYCVLKGSYDSDMMCDGKGFNNDLASSSISFRCVNYYLCLY